jgi:iron(III) transport system substrate-binding protein
MIAALRPGRARTITLTVVAALAGCGGSGDSEREKGKEAFEKVFDQTEGLKGEQREAKLLKLAQGEGAKVTWYTSLTDDTEAAIADAFEDEYDIEVSVYRSTSETVAQRVSDEADADFRGTDVVETGGDEMAQLDQDDVFVPYDPAGAQNLAPGSRPDWAVSRFNRFVVAWNTDLVRADEIPSSFEGLAEPRWKGKLAIEAGDPDWYRTLRDYLIEQEGKSEDEADRIFEGIARNSSVVTAHALVNQLLGAGEFAVAVSNYLHQTRDLIDDGAPVAYKPFVEPVVSRPQGVGLLQTSEHPAAAVLFEDWLTSDGQEVLADHNVSPARKDLVEEIGVKEALVNVDSFVEESDEWNDRYEELLRLGKEVEGGG